MTNSIHASIYVAVAREYEAELRGTRPGVRVQWDSASQTFQVKLNASWVPLLGPTAAQLQTRAEELAAEKLPPPQTKAQADAADVYHFQQRARSRTSPRANFTWDDSTNMWSDTDSGGIQRHYRQNSRKQWVEKTWDDNRQTWRSRALSDGTPADRDRLAGLDKLSKLTRSTTYNGANWTENTPDWWKSATGGGGWASDLFAKYDFASPVAALGATYKSVKEGAESGGQIVDSIASGIKANAHALSMAGEFIVDALTRPLFASLGRTGNALQNVVKTGTGLVGSGAGMLGDTVTGGIKLAGGLVGGGVAVGGGMLGAGIGAAAGLGVGAAPGWMVGMAAGTAVGAVIMKVFEEVAEKIGGILKGLGTAFGVFGEAVGSVLSSIVETIQDAAETGLRYARALMQVREGGGYSGSGASSLLSAFGTFGVSPQEVASNFGNQNALYTGARASMWNLSGLGMDGSADGEEFIKSLRERFHGFVQDYGAQVGTMLGRSMLGNFGLDGPEMLSVMHIGNKRFDAAQEFGKNLGMDPDAAQKWVEDFGQLQAQIGQFVEYVKTQLGTALLPAMQKGLELVVAYFKGHQKQITDQLWAFGEFMYVDFPLILMKGLRAIIGVASTFLHGIDAFIKALHNGNANPFVDFIDQFVHAFDFLAEMIKRHIGLIKLLGMTFSDVARTLSMIPASIQAAFSGLGSWVLKKLGLDGLGSGLTNYSQTMWNWATNYHSAQEYQDAAQMAFLGNGTHGTGMATAWDSYRNSLSPINGNTAVGNAADDLDQRYKDLDNGINKYDKDARRQDFQDLRKSMSDLNDTLEKGITVHSDHKVSLSTTEDLVAKVASFVAIAMWRKMDNAVGGGG